MFLTADDDVSVIGSSNMDQRSFYLGHEISLTVLGPDFVAQLQAWPSSTTASARSSR